MNSKTLLTATAVIAFSTSAIASMSEKEAQAIICEELRTNVTVPGGGWADCVSETHAIEVDWSGKWAEAIGQSLYYACELDKKPAIYLVCKEGQKLCISHGYRLESTTAAWSLPAADATLVLKREAINTGDAVLYGRGRDIPEFQLALSFDDRTCQWSCLGDASEFRANKEAQEVIDALKTSDQAMSAQDIEEVLDDMPVGNIRKRLKRMSDRGQIVKVSTGMYKTVQPVQVSNMGDKL